MWYVQIFKLVLAIADTVACKKAIAKWPFFVHSSLLFTNKGSKHIDLMSKKVKQGVTLRHRRRRIQATWPHYITSTAAETRIPIIPQLEMYNASRRLLKKPYFAGRGIYPLRKAKNFNNDDFMTTTLCHKENLQLDQGWYFNRPKKSAAKNM